MEMQCVFCVVETQSINLTFINLSLQKINPLTEKLNGGAGIAQSV
jgi:hypothetical protein